MQFNNKQFGSAAKPFKESPFTQYNEFAANDFPPPPEEFRITDNGDRRITDNGDNRVTDN